MLAAAARDSHRSPSDRQLLSPDRDAMMMMASTTAAAAATIQADGEKTEEEAGDAASTGETETGAAAAAAADADVNPFSTIGVAAFEAGVGNGDSLFVNSNDTVTANTTPAQVDSGVREEDRNIKKKCKKPSKRATAGRNSSNDNTTSTTSSLQEAAGGPLTATSKGTRLGGVEAPSMASADKKGIASGGNSSSATAAAAAGITTTGGDGERVAAYCGAADGVGNCGDEAKEQATGGGVGVESDDAPIVVAAKPKRLSTERSQHMYEGHRQTQEKLQSLRDESATTGCTFSPRLSSKQKQRTLEEGSAWDHLYKESHKQQERRGKLVEEASSRHSFQPMLPTSKSPLAVRATDASAAASRQRAEEKTKATEKLMYCDYTFAPNTSGTKAFSAKVAAGKGEQVNLVDRLYASQEMQQALLKTREDARTSLELKPCTFTPDTTVSQRSSACKSREDSGKVHERLYGTHCEVQMKKEARREEMVAKELRECTFSPALVAKASEVPKQPGADEAETAGGEVGRVEPAFERLYRLRIATETPEEFVDPECTFRPKIITDRTLDASAVGTNGNNNNRETGAARLEQLYAVGKLKQATRSLSPKNYTASFVERDEEGEMAECSFQPNLSPTAKSRFKAEARGKHIFDTLHAMTQDISSAKERVEAEAMKVCTFSPELASHKTRVGRSLSPKREKPVHEELYGAAGAQRLAKAQAVPQEDKDNTFSPELVSQKTRAGRSLSPQRTGPVHEELYKTADSQRLTKEQQSKEAETLQSKQCTFQPNLVARPRSPRSPRSPRGSNTPSGHQRKRSEIETTTTTVNAAIIPEQEEGGGEVFASPLSPPTSATESTGVPAEAFPPVPPESGGDY